MSRELTLPLRNRTQLTAAMASHSAIKAHAKVGPAFAPDSIADPMAFSGLLDGCSGRADGCESRRSEPCRVPRRALLGAAAAAVDSAS